MRTLVILFAGCITPWFASAEVPVYRVESIATYSSTLSLRGASGTGWVVGETEQAGQLRPYVASLDGGLVLLPLPAGYLSGIAFDVNRAGVVVGTIATNGLPWDSGVPAAWVPNSSGGFDVVLPDTFATLASPLNPNHPIQGGQAVAINDDGIIVGWSRFQGFLGGPPTRFFLTGAPQDLRVFGFEGTTSDLSQSGIVVGNSQRLDLHTGVVTDIGVPPPASGSSFSASYIYSVNDHGQTVLAARLSTSSSNRWLTYLHDDQSGFTRLNPAVLPSVNVGFYDNNNLGDVSASGGVLWRAEGVLSNGFDGLLGSGFSQWDTTLGFLGDDRWVATRATHVPTGQQHLVFLIPEDVGVHVCGPGQPNSTGSAATIGATGSAFALDNNLTLTVQGLPVNQFAIFLNGTAQGFVNHPGGSQGNLCLGGVLGRYNAPGQILTSGLGGQAQLSLDLTQAPSAAGVTAMVQGQTWFFQCWYRDLNPGSTSNFSDALLLTFH